MCGSQNQGYFPFTPNATQLHFPGFAYNTCYNSLPVMTKSHDISENVQVPNKPSTTSGTFQGNLSQFQTWHSPVPFPSTVAVSDNILSKTYSDPINLSVHTKYQNSHSTDKGPDEQCGEVQDVKVNYTQFNIKSKECERSVMTQNLNVNKNSKKGIFHLF